MKVSAVIPAFNEAQTIGRVLDVITTFTAIDEIVVVSDGSTDNTVEVVRQYPVRMIELKENIGKGGALQRGIDSASGDILVFLDADLIGLTTKHLEDMMQPVLLNQVEMVIGIFDNGRLTTDLAQVFAPYLSGQRVLKRSVIQGLDNLEMTRFGVEIALTVYAKTNQIACQEVKLSQMSHVMKEEKLGFFPGVLYRLKMYWEIVKVLAQIDISLK